MLDLWFKDAVIYCLDVDAYQDLNGDGVGDFAGLMSRLDHIAGLGATCIWLLPFYPTPDRDNGFDVMEYYGVGSKLGTLGEFVDFIRCARERGLRVIIDLVANHTSDQHPWFQQARKDRNSPFRDYYVWSDDPPEDGGAKDVVFPGEQQSVWTYDEVAESHYFHHFYKHQPDLNLANPAVREEISRVMGFWLELGVSGFRVDAAPFMINQPGTADALQEFRQFLSWRRGDAILLAEANVPPDLMPEYFDDGVHMMFNFWVNQHIMLSLARQDTGPLIAAIKDIPKPPPIAQFANFVRNHDELDLGRLSDKDREEVFRAFAPDENMRIYGRGIRRRMASMLKADQDHIRLAYSFMFSLPGTPVLRYGEEIGMGEDLSIPSRGSVRTAMQWCSDPNAGFSTADPQQLLRPIISDGDFGYQKINVADQSRHPNSQLNWMERLIRVRKQCPELGHGEFQLLPGDHKSIVAHRCDWKDGAIVAVHNFSDGPVTWQATASGDVTLVEIFGPDSQASYKSGQTVQLPRFGYRWFRVTGPGYKHR